MKHLTLALGLLAGLCPTALALTCIKPGKTQSVHLSQPALGPGSGTGLPTSAVWLPGTSRVYDADTWSADDPLPGHTEANGVISVDVMGVGGKLADANGSIIDCCIEGSCIEVYFTQAYTYTAVTTGCIELSTPGVSTQVCAEVERSFRATYRSPQIKVCPC